MNSYEKIYSFLTEGVDKEAFKDFWSQHIKAGERRAKPTRASKKTQAATERRKKKVSASGKIHVALFIVCIMAVDSTFCQVANRGFDIIL